jgi:hypothetical protein
MSNERRRDLRINVSPPAHIVSIGLRHPVQILNASYHSIFVRMAEKPKVGELLKLEITLPEATIRIHAVPLRVLDDTKARVGVGARLFALGGEEKRIWERYIASMLAPRVAA